MNHKVIAEIFGIVITVIILHRTHVLIKVDENALQ